MQKFGAALTDSCYSRENNLCSFPVQLVGLQRKVLPHLYVGMMWLQSQQKCSYTRFFSAYITQTGVFLHCSWAPKVIKLLQMGSGELARWLRLRKLRAPVVSCCSEYSLARPEPQHFSKSCVAVGFFFKVLGAGI